MPKPLTITAKVSIRAADKGEPKRRRFAIAAYTGSALHLPAFEHPLYLDISGIETESGTERCPVLYDHGGIAELEDDEPTPDQKDYLVGQTTSVRLGKTLDVEGFFLNSTAIGREVQAIAAEGYQWQASVGADPDEDRLEEIGDGETAEVNGQTVQGPCIISRRTLLGEISFVVFGADPRTVARITAMKARLASKGIAMTFESWVKDTLKLDLATLGDEQKAALQSAFDKLHGEAEDDTVEAGDDEEPEVAAEDDEKPTVTAKKKPARVFQASKAALERAGEARRIAALEDACKGHPRILASALEKNWTVDRAKLHVLRASRAHSPTPQAGSNPGQGGTVDVPALEAALLLSVGVAPKLVAKWYGDKTVDKATGKDHRGLTLHYVMDRVIEASGDYYRGSRKTEGFIKAALRAERKILAASGGGASTVSLSNILENVAQKSLLAGYEAVNVTWPEFCATSNHPDFRPKARYRLDATGSFKRVNADGELQHIGLADAKYSGQLDTYGAIISLTRQMQQNDDLGAFADIPKLLGRMSALRTEEAVYITLLGMVASGFFAAGNRNYLTGTDGALSIGGLTALEQKFSDQVDSNGKPVLTMPSRLLVPSTLKVTADSLNREQTIVATTTANKPLTANNPHVGKYKPISSTYLNNTAIKDQDGAALTGQSDTGWYLFADPSVRAAIVVGFLNGQQQPTVQSSDEVFTVLGMQWRAYSDFGVSEEDPVAAAFATGVAP